MRGIPPLIPELTTMQAPSRLDALIKHIQAAYPTLSPQLQTAARYLIDHPIQVSTLSARKLAVLAKVEPTTLVRLAQHFRYAGWGALKSVFMQDLNLPPDSYAARAESLVKRSEPLHTVWEIASAQHSRNLSLLNAANRQVMPRAVNHLLSASRILIAGFRSCYPAAFSFGYLCNLFRSDVHLLHNTGGTMDLDVYHLRSSDTVVLISYAPYSREISVVAEAAHTACCHVITLCDSKLAPIALTADEVMMFSTQGNSFFPSTVALHALVEMLAQQLLVRGGEDAINELARTESCLRATSAYL